MLKKSIAGSLMGLLLLIQVVPSAEAEAPGVQTKKEEGRTRELKARATLLNKAFVTVRASGASLKGNLTGRLAEVNDTGIVVETASELGSVDVAYRDIRSIDPYALMANSRNHATRWRVVSAVAGVLVFGGIPFGMGAFNKR